MVARITLLGAMLLERFSAVLAVAAVVAAVGVTPGHAQAPARRALSAGPAATQTSPATSEPPGILPPDEFGRGTPRGTIDGFLVATDARNYARAAAYLDLSRLPAAGATTQGPMLARRLRVVLDQVLPLDPKHFSHEPDGILNDGQPPDREVVGRIETKKGGVTLFLDRVASEDGVPVWKIAAGTVARIPALYAEFGHGPMGELLPPMFVEVRLFDIALWQWIALLCLVPASLLVARIIVVSLSRVVSDLARRTGFSLMLRIAHAVAAPITLLIAVALFNAVRRALSLAAAVH